MVAIYIPEGISSLEAFLQLSLRKRGYACTQDKEAAGIWVISTASEQKLLSSLEQKHTKSDSKIIILSSSKVYGESNYLCGDCGQMGKGERLPYNLEKKRWEVFCPICKDMMMPQPMDETCQTSPSRKNEAKLLLNERLLERTAKLNHWEYSILRVFNPYWPSTAFIRKDNKVIATFTRSLLENQAPVIYEDGNQYRDFTFGQDLVNAIDLIIQKSKYETQIYNLGTGQKLTIWQLAGYLLEFLNKSKTLYEISEQYQSFNVRHRFADISKAQKELGYTPEKTVDSLESFCKATFAAQNLSNH